MRLIKPSFEIIEQQPGLQGIYEQIELAGRTCYKSEPKYDYYLYGNLIKLEEGETEVGYDVDLGGQQYFCSDTPENIFKLYPNICTRISSTAKDFVNRMIKSGHGAMLEHGTVYLHLSGTSRKCFESEIVKKYEENKYSKVQEKFEDSETDYRDWYVTTNYRVLVENNWLDDLQYLCEPTEYHEKRITVKFITQIAITREANRHRVNSIAESSTRYCNYSKDKFGNEISINVPTFIDESKIDLEYPSFRGLCHCIYDKEDDVIFSDITYWIFANLACEYAYMNLIRLGWKPEQARTVLPLDTNSELVHTAFVSDWEHFFNLRCHKSAHQDIRALAEPLKDEFIKRNLI